MTIGRWDPANSRASTFVGGKAGAMLVVSQNTRSGQPIAPAERIDVIAGISAEAPDEAVWSLCGVTTNDRYTTRSEKAELISRQAPIGRPEATSAALILLRKNAEWWAMSQDERRTILEENSHHIAIGLRYLPGVARRLLHCRDLGFDAPFDFIGLLDYAPAYEMAFDEMLGQLRATKEWTFMEREVDIRLVKIAE